MSEIIGEDAVKKATSRKRTVKAPISVIEGGKDERDPFGGYNVDLMNQEYALVLMGSKSVVIREQPLAPIEDRFRILTVEAFKTMLLNRHFDVLDRNGKERTVTYAQAWLSDRRRRTYDGIEFFPNPDEATNTPGYLNLWRGFSVEAKAKANGYAVFADHLLTNVCNGDKRLFEWVFGWFAHMVQRPRERLGTALVLRGKMGSGKTKIGEVIGSLFAAHFYMVDDPRYIVGQFNAHMASCLLLQAEEAVWAGDRAAEGRLKGLVTSSFQMIENKGIDPIRVSNFVRLMMTSNESWVVPAGKDERRFCVLDVDPRCAQNHTYFREMDEELSNGGREALLHDLLAFDLSAVDLRTIPKTGALLEQKLQSLDSIDSWWSGRLVSGNITKNVEGWPDTIPVATLYADYIANADALGVRRKKELTAFGIHMNKIVPNLKRVRMTITADVNTKQRSWCYEMPSLLDCRDFIEQEMGQAIPWDDI